MAHLTASVTKKYRLIEIREDDAPMVVTPMPKDEERCPHTFPGRPDIRCKHRLHLNTDKVCYAADVDPYYSVFWEHIEIKEVVQGG